VPTTPKDTLEGIFQKMVEAFPNQELHCENDNSDDDDNIGGNRYIRLPPTQKGALQCV
jgi:hypothetical protein